MRYILLVAALLAANTYGATVVGGGGGSVAPQEGADFDVAIQDQTTVPFDYFFTQIKGAPTTVATTIGAIGPTTLIYDVEVTSAAGCSLGDYVGIFNADDPANNRAYFGTILAINSNTLTLDTPLDFSFQAGDTVGCFTRELDVDGSVTPQIFSIEVGPNADQSIDITRLMISMYTATAVDLGSFGDLTSLTNGCVLRRVDGTIHNLYNVKNNGELANITFDYTPYTAAGQAQDGAKFRNTYNGTDKHGVTIRLDPGDELQWVIQDDLTGLTQFRIIAQGHYVDP